MSFRVILTLFVAWRLIQASASTGFRSGSQLFDVDFHGVTFQPTKKHKTSFCNNPIVVNDKHVAEVYTTSGRDGFRCSTSEHFFMGEPRFPIVRIEGLRDNQARYQGMGCMLTNFEPTRIMPSIEPLLASAEPLHEGLRSPLWMSSHSPQVSPEASLEFDVFGNPFETYSPHVPFDVAVKVAAPSIDGVEFGGVVASSNLVYVLVMAPTETCVFSAPKAKRFDVAGTYRLLKSNVETFAPAPICKDTLQLKPDVDILDASDMLFDGSPAPCLTGSFDLVEPAVFPQSWKQTKLYSTARQVVPHFGATIQEPMKCNGSAVYVGAARLSLNARIFDFVMMKNASFFGILTSSTPHDPDSYRVCLYSTNVTTKGLSTLMRGDHAIATAFWAVVVSILVVIVVLSLAVVTLLTLRRRQNRKDFYRTGEVGMEEVRNN